MALQYDWFLQGMSFLVDKMAVRNRIAGTANDVVTVRSVKQIVHLFVFLSLARLVFSCLDGAFLGCAENVNAKV